MAEVWKLQTLAHGEDVRALLTKAMAAGTNGHKTFTYFEAVHELDQHTLKKWIGLNPFLPDSPLGWMPRVTAWPFELYSGSLPSSCSCCGLGSDV